MGHFGKKNFRRINFSTTKLPLESSKFLEILQYDREEMRVPTPLIGDWREECVGPALRRFRAPDMYSFKFFVILDDTFMDYTPELIAKFMENCTIVITLYEIPRSLLLPVHDLTIISKINPTMNILNFRKYLNIIIGMYNIYYNRF